MAQILRLLRMAIEENHILKEGHRKYYGIGLASMIRSGRRTYRRPFLYNAPMDDVRELPRKMGDWVIGNLCNSYQDRKFEQDRMEKIQFAMTEFLSHQ